jgi:predicted phage terminase large subunit-like protein
MQYRAVAAKHCRRLVIVDLAFTLKKENDWTVILAVAVTPGHDILLLDLHRERMEGPDIPRAITAMYRAYDAQYVAIEANQAQILVVQGLRKAGLTVRALRADQDKLSRAIPATVRMEAGQIYLPESAHWRADFVEELLGFPHAAHDDQVDCLAYAAIEVQRFGPAAEPDSYGELRSYAEKEQAAELWNQVDNPLLWVGDEDDE